MQQRIEKTWKECETCKQPFLCGPDPLPRPRQRNCSMNCMRLSRMLSTPVARLMSATDAAYFAGIVDGEGSLTIPHRKRPEGRFENPNIKVEVINTDFALLRWLEVTAGVGAILTRRTVEGRRPMWSWRAERRQASTLLAQIRPYMRVKHRQADLLLEHQALLLDPEGRKDRAQLLANVARIKEVNRNPGGGGPCHTAASVLQTDSPPRSATRPEPWPTPRTSS